jgi:hypothetical protein
MVFWFCWNKTEPNWKIVAKPEPNHNQMFFEIRNQTQPKPNQIEKNWNQSQFYLKSKNTSMQDKIHKAKKKTKIIITLIKLLFIAFNFSFCNLYNKYEKIIKFLEKKLCECAVCRKKYIFYLLIYCWIKFGIKIYFMNKNS